MPGRFYTRSRAAVAMGVAEPPGVARGSPHLRDHAQRATEWSQPPKLRYHPVVPQAFLFFFQSDDEKWPMVAGQVPVLLRFVTLYSFFDSMTIVFSFALRGAGDTRFVTIVSLALAWPLMVLPTWAAWHFQWGLYWAWGFASTYVIAMGITFLLRFRAGKWQSMRVIERAPVAEVAVASA